MSGKTRILSPRVARRVVLPSRCSGSLAESAVMCRCVLRVIAAGPKQASLSYPVLVCVCVRVFLTALLAAWVETTTPSWTAAGGGRKSRAAGRTRGGTPSGIRSHLRRSIWVWPPLTPIKHLLPHASPPKLNAKIRSKLPFRCALQRKRQTGDVCLATGRNLPASAKVVVLR